VVHRLEQRCGVALAGSYLRIEYCLDTTVSGWSRIPTSAPSCSPWVYLSDDPGSKTWGTDLLDGPVRLVATMPYRRNSGCIFIPGPNTWHGFDRRPIVGFRRSLIVNYVKPE
jgi:hypothetical protein